jgi:hypothetical protein
MHSGFKMFHVKHFGLLRCVKRHKIRHHITYYNAKKTSPQGVGPAGKEEVYSALKAACPFLYFKKHLHRLK